jgi:ABC-type transport system involved in cytochrome c biogenesis permease component
MRHVLTLLRKDLQLELRSGAQILPLLTVSILLVSFLALGIGALVTEEEIRRELFHPILWSVFIVTGSMSLLRVFEADRGAKTLSACFVFDVSATAFYLSKVLFVSILLFGNTVFSSLLLAALLDVSLLSHWYSLLVLLGIVTIGYSALGCFLAGLVLEHQHRQILFPLILLPLLFPLFFGVIEVSLVIFTASGLLSVGGWFSLIIALTTTYLLIGVSLFEIVARN